MVKIDAVYLNSRATYPKLYTHVEQLALKIFDQVGIFYLMKYKNPTTDFIIKQ